MERNQMNGRASPSNSTDCGGTASLFQPNYSSRAVQVRKNLFLNHFVKPQMLSLAIMLLLFFRVLGSLLSHSP
jgi:hypothetical protein